MLPRDQPLTRTSTGSECCCRCDQPADAGHQPDQTAGTRHPLGLAPGADVNVFAVAVTDVVLGLLHLCLGGEQRPAEVATGSASFFCHLVIVIRRWGRWWRMSMTIMHTTTSASAAELVISLRTGAIYPGRHGRASNRRKCTSQSTPLTTTNPPKDTRDLSHYWTLRGFRLALKRPRPSAAER